MRRFPELMGKVIAISVLIIIAIAVITLSFISVIAAVKLVAEVGRALLGWN